jgi:hypothetical protein
MSCIRNLLHTELVRVFANRIKLARGRELPTFIATASNFTATTSPRHMPEDEILLGYNAVSLKRRSTPTRLHGAVSQIASHTPT